MLFSPSWLPGKVTDSQVIPTKQNGGQMQGALRAEPVIGLLWETHEETSPSVISVQGRFRKKTETKVNKSHRTRAHLAFSSAN
jgi:hypothetical protein